MEVVCIVFNFKCNSATVTLIFSYYVDFFQKREHLSYGVNITERC